jgi:hypothetical protein
MANVDEPATCAHCGRPLPSQHGKGRRRRFCNATCRSAARRDRAERVNVNLTNPSRKGSLDDVGVGETPLKAVVEALELTRAADRTLRAAVERAREAGHSWQEIGAVLGTSRQAAFQRFGRPIDPRTGAAMTEATLPGAAERAVAVLADIVEGRWEQACRDFDETMAAAVDPAKIAAVWAQVAGTVGRYERMGTPFARQLGDYTVVDVPLHCEAGEVTGRVSYNRDGTVGGLFLLPTEAV